MTEGRLFFWVYLLLLVSPSEFPVVVGHNVQATVGDDVILPCYLEPPSDVSNLTVDWTRNGSNVHIYRNKKDDHDPQDKQFRNRTSLFHHEMTRGNISLKLTNVTEEDAGLYICYVPRLNSQVKRGDVRLIVLIVKPLNDTAGSGGDNETPDDQTGVIAGSVLGPVLIFAVLAVIIYFVNKRTGLIRRWRRRRNN